MLDGNSIHLLSSTSKISLPQISERSQSSGDEEIENFSPREVKNKQESSSSSEEYESVEGTKRKTCMLYPDDLKKKTWDIIVGVLLLLTCLYVPYRLSLGFNKQDTKTMVAVNLSVDFIFLMDILVQFNSAYYIS